MMRPRLEHPLILHDAPETFLELVNATARYIGVPAVYVEKDYWVTLVLKGTHLCQYTNVMGWDPIGIPRHI